MTSILLLRSAHLSALSVSMRASVCVSTSECVCKFQNIRCTVAPKRAHNYFNAHARLWACVCVCAYAGIVCARCLCVCVCVFGCVVVGRVYYNFPRFFITLNFSTQVEFFLLCWRRCCCCCCLCFSSTLCSVFLQFFHSKPIRKRRASQVSLCVVVVAVVHEREATNAAIDADCAAASVELPQLSKMWQGLCSNNNSNNMVKCQLEFIIVHYSFSYYTHTHALPTHTHTSTDNES